MKTSNHTADSTEGYNFALSALAPPKKKTEVDEPNHFTEDDDDDFDGLLDDGIVSLDELDQDDDDY